MTSFGRLALVAFGLSLGVWCSSANATGSDGDRQTCVAADDYMTHPNEPQPNVECGFDADLTEMGSPSGSSSYEISLVTWFP
ncbi:MAG: hypothetical protein HOK28_19695 [Deltaproteobacteria bacterium]|jgi:hypothetical protein|nr:hypothetical protein [Deltaproteobacteria bacterium]